MDEFKSAMMKSVDLGGIRCPCCNPTFTNKNYDQTLLRKMARARIKQKDRYDQILDEANP